MSYNSNNYNIKNNRDGNSEENSGVSATATLTPTNFLTLIPHTTLIDNRYNTQTNNTNPNQSGIDIRQYFANIISFWATYNHISNKTSNYNKYYNASKSKSLIHNYPFNPTTCLDITSLISLGLNPSQANCEINCFLCSLLIIFNVLIRLILLILLNSTNNNTKQNLINK